MIVMQFVLLTVVTVSVEIKSIMLDVDRFNVVIVSVLAQML
jgi:hypothetical protein